MTRSRQKGMDGGFRIRTPRNNSTGYTGSDERKCFAIGPTEKLQLFLWTGQSTVVPLLLPVSQLVFRYRSRLRSAGESVLVLVPRTFVDPTLWVHPP